MEIIENALLGERYYKEVLPSGLTVLVYERPDRVGAYAMLTARIGSVTRRFKSGDSERTVPAGIAHFLEHKLFEGPQGDAFTLFAATGASANAYTSFDKTCYLFNANDNINESLRILVDFVGSPYFTEENVAKEQGIIGEEIRMYDDSDYWQLMYGVLGLLYSRHPIRDDIAGTEKTIAGITADMLYDCYRSFYTPSGMILSAAGNVKHEDVIEIARAFDPSSAAPTPAEPVSCGEPRGICGGFGKKSMAIAARQFCVGFKSDAFPQKERLRLEMELDILLDALFGETTDFYRELYDGGLINSTFFCDMLSGTDYLSVMVGGESDEPEKVRDRVLKELDRARRDGVDRERIEEAVRAHYGDEIIDFESNEDIATDLAFLELKGYSIYDILDMLAAVTPQRIDALLSVFDESRMAMFVLEPLDDEKAADRYEK